MPDPGRRRQRRGRPAGDDPSRSPIPGSGRRASLLRQCWLLFRKDMLTELRNRETLLTLLFFALLLVVIFTFSFWADDELAVAVSPGVLWVTVAFTGTLGIDRSFAREQEGRTLTALMLIPGTGHSLYMAKVLVNMAYMLAVELFATPLTLIMLGTPLRWEQVPMLAAALLAGTTGFAAVGTVFSAMLVSVRRRGVLLPIILYPVAIPLLVMGVKAVAALVGNHPTAELWSWLKLMLAVDVLYLVAGGWLFGQVIEDDG